ncbi:MAG: hypothetical protein FWD17_15155 [Polyangiaceae bacterium]|nr:hypothetical protein [Polyangiaceae bacterium]
MSSRRPSIPSQSVGRSGTHPALGNIGDEAELYAEIDRLEEDNAQLRHEIDALREAVAARDVFLGVAGLELRNALGGILVAATNLRFRASQAAGVPGWVAERVEVIARESLSFVRRATALLDAVGLRAGLTRDTDEDHRHRR